MNINGANTATKVSETLPHEIPPSPPPQDKSAELEQKQGLQSQDESREETFSSQETKQMVEEMNDIMDDLHTSLGFSVREDLQNRQVVVEIKDRDTNELIKQIPSEEMLTIKEKMLEFTGLLFDQNV